ncbi:hypothetical protein Rhe02_59820 [Rhizocola hellebori]|uniref:DUF2335 domain-containing protein n=1 Tax=Rhizocola hellebori TaxID=1392758 RepID=A0A8J3VIT2_9ACTN|nr:hypothetical protein [Rhizocola hellebori]GIH07915.1 hypothetical protein Rhe02_59820 [Rhizocola hellebori]
MSEQPIEPPIGQLRSVSTTPTLSDEGRRLIEGELNRENYIERSRRRAETAALIAVNAEIARHGAVPALIASLFVGGSIAVALLAQQAGAGWALVAGLGVIGSAVPLAVLTVRETRSGSF